MVHARILALGRLPVAYRAALNADGFSQFRLGKPGVAARKANTVLGIHGLCDANHSIEGENGTLRQQGTTQQFATFTHVDTKVVLTLSAFGSMLLKMACEISEIGPLSDVRSPGLAYLREPPVFPAQSTMRNFSPSR